jgi:uncharacterized protein (TIGR02678 family)
MNLADAVATSHAEGKRRAARALLRRPLLTGTDEAFVLVRRHSQELREWFGRNTGWHLHVDSEVARLVKRAGSDDATYPARDTRSRQPFSRRRYVLTCLALAALERGDAQVTLGRLAEDVVLGAADPRIAAAGLTFTLEGRSERADLVAVVRLLLGLSVLRRVAGDEDAFVKETGDALYDVERRVLATLVAAPRGPSTVHGCDFESRLAELAQELPATTDELRNRAVRYRLTRRLLDEPVLYFDELDAEERTYLAGQRSAITARIAELTGLVPEIRAEGIAMVDPADDLTDVRMPETGTEGHATLLLAEHLGRRGACTTGELVTETGRNAAAHRAYWRRDTIEPAVQAELTQTAVERLVALRLVRRDGDTVTALPALARYAVDEPTVLEPS